MISRILVLGSNSFAGSQYIAEAIKTATVQGISRSAEKSALFLPCKNSPYAHNYRFFQFDLNHDFEQLVREVERFQPQVIVDFAGQGMVAESWLHPQQWYQTNIVSKVRLHHYLSDKPWLHKYIRVSTPEVYGSSETLLDESAGYNPSTPYAVSHAATDMSLTAYFKQYDFPVVFTRFSNFYGPGQQLYRIVPRTIIYALTGKTLMLHGGGTAVRAFIHGRDVASAIARVVEAGQSGETYHFSTSDFITIKALVSKIHQLIGIERDDLIEVSADRPGKDLKYLMNDTKARKNLQWAPSVSLDQGLAETIDWVRQHLDEITNHPMDYQHKE